MCFSVQIPRARAHSFGSRNSSADGRPRLAHNPQEPGSCDEVRAEPQPEYHFHSQREQFEQQHQLEQQQFEQQQQEHHRRAPTGVQQASVDSCGRLEAEQSRPEVDEAPVELEGERAERPAEPQRKAEEAASCRHELQLKKAAFNCMLLGTRQTGKKTLVKCFVKLLDEFKLASDEFKREKMLSKLVECSERIHELAKQQQLREEQLARAELAHQKSASRRRRRRSSAGEDCEEAGSELREGRRGRRASRLLQTMHRRRSRLNSWFGERVGTRLLNLSPSSARRLQTLVGSSLRARTDTRSSSPDAQTETPAERPTVAGAQLAPEVDAAQRCRRRHTTIEAPMESPGSSLAARAEGATGNEERRQLGSSRRLDVGELAETRAGQSQGLRQPAARRSQLCVVADMGRNKSDTNINYLGSHNCPSTPTSDWPGREQQAAVARLHPVDREVQRDSQPAECLELPAGRRRSSIVGGRRQVAVEARRKSSLGQPLAAACRRRQSFGVARIGRRRRKLLLSLKELNRRKWAVKFNIRRQLSDRMQQQLAQQMGDHSTCGQETPEPLGDSLMQSRMPDAFLVVYSINDR